MIQRKYHPSTTFNITSCESYLEQIGTPHYHDAGYKFDISDQMLLDPNWKYKVEDWMTEEHANNAEEHSNILNSSDMMAEYEVGDKFYAPEDSYIEKSAQSDTSMDSYDVYEA